MSDAITATRAQIQIGSITVDGFMLPDGSYRMSQTQAAECVGKPEINARRFLSSKAIKRLLGEDYTPDSIPIENDSSTRGQARFNSIPLEVVAAYWIHQCFQGNKTALSLVVAITSEILERRFDFAFNIERTEEERNDRLAQRIGELETQISNLSEAYAEPEDLREQVSRLEDQIRQLGQEPWTISEDDK